MLGRVRTAYTALPVPMRVGTALLVSGVLVDIAYHLSIQGHASSHHAIAGFGHFITLAGMVVTMLGLVAFARKRSSRRNTNRLKGVTQ